MDGLELERNNALGRAIVSVVKPCKLEDGSDANARAHTQSICERKVEAVHNALEHYSLYNA